MLGFRQDLGFAGSVQSVAAFAIHPEIDAPETEAGGLDEAAIRSWENLNLGDAMEAEVGSTQVVARFGGHSPNTVTAALPYATVAWRKSNSTIHYGMTTMMPGGENADETQAQTWLPKVSVRNGDLVLEHGLHQEIGWERKTDRSGMTVLVFADKIDNPMLDAMSRVAGNGAAQIAGSGSALFDPASGMLRAAGPNFSSAGVAATLVRQLPGGDLIRLSYANGDALAMPAASEPASLEQVNATAHPRRAQTYALSLSGTLEGTGTRWRASYRWQPEDTVTSVAPYSANAMEPYLNLHICQPIHMRHDGASGFEALLDLRNLLAQGYRPYLLGDGSVVVFAQDQRGVQGGLAFTF
jgi:hypothetical protein